MAILITGGCGYIGSHTCIEMLNAGYDIVVVARHRCVDGDFQKLTHAYLSLAKKAGILLEQ